MHVSRHYFVNVWHYCLLLLSILFSASAVAAVPPIPSLSVPSSDSDGRYTVLWGSAAGASRYELVGEQSGTIYSGTFQMYPRNKPPGTYYYKVRACNSSGCSAYSGKKGITVGAPTAPSIPSLTVPSSDSDGSYTVSWGSSSGATRYELVGESSGTLYSGSGRSLTRTKPNGTYSYKVRACSSAGCSSYSGIKSITVNIPLAVPGTPSTPSVSKSGGNDLSVSWSAKSGASHYDTQYSVNGGTWKGLSKHTSTSAQYNNQAVGSYRYRVRACNADYACSGFSGASSTVTVYAVPGTPSAPSATLSGGDDITVSWNAVANAAHYYRQVSLNSGSWQNTTKFTTTSVTYTNQQARSYRYRVKACNADNICSGYSGASATVTVLPVPVAPNAPSVSKSGGNDLTVSWNAVSHAAHYYRQVSLNGGAWQNRNKYTTTSVLFADQQPRSYKYRVQACNANNICSGYSPASATVTVYPVPATPTSISVSKSGGNDLSVSWTAMSNAAHYYTQVSVNSGSWTSTTKYTGTSAQNNNKSAGSYRYRVKACNVDNICSGYTAASATVTVLPVPVAPAAPIASLSGGNDISVRWLGVANAAHYYRQVSIDNGAWQNTTKFTTTKADYPDQQPRSYRYRVNACNADNICSAYSSASTTVTVLSVPAAPNTPSVSKASGNDITVSWNAVTHAAHYYSQVSIDSGSWQTPNKHTGNSAKFNDQQPRSYRYRVKACNADDICSGYSLASTSVTVYPVPLKPIFVNVSKANGNDLTVSWTQMPDAVHYYTQVSLNNGSWTGTTKYTSTSAQNNDQAVGSYRYRVKSCNVDNICSVYSDASETVSVLPIPAIPGAPTATLSNGNDITIQWSAVAGASHYHREVSIDNAAWQNSTKYTSTTAVYNDQQPRSYRYRVKACNADNICSDFSEPSNTVTVLPIPAIPVVISVNKANGNDITLSWQAVAEANHYYREVSVNNAAWKNRTKYTGTSAVMANQVPGSYRYRLQACNASEQCSEYSDPTAPIEVFAVPVAPTAPNVAVNNRDDITVSWNAVNGAAHYYRQVSLNDGAWQNETKHTTTTLTYNDQQIRSYRYRVKACNVDDICSAYSPASATAVVAPLMVVEQFEWVPNEVLVDEPTAFHWNVTNATTCYALTAGENSSSSRAASGQTESYTYDEPEIHLTQWYCEDDYGNRLPQDENQYLEATRTVKAIGTVSIGTVDVANLNSQNASYEIRWTTNGEVIHFDLVEEKDGVWGSVQNLTETSKSFVSKAAGRYRYKVRACEANGCSAYKISAAFDVSAFTPSADVSSSVSLAGLSNNVGFTAGQFRVSESGAATYTVPLSLPEGVAGVKPQIALNYSSQGGDSTLGRGWSLSAGDAVIRCPRNIFNNNEIAQVNYDDSDLFCVGGQQLVLKSGNYGQDGSTYYTRIDNLSVVTAHGSAGDSGPLYFTVATKSGDTFYYGQTPDSDDLGDGFVEPNNPAGNNDLAKFWALKKVVDVSGNVIRYHYNEQSDIGLHNLARVEYGANENVTASRYFNQINFNYTSNPKPQVGYSAGSSFTMNQLLESISISVDGSSYRFYDLSYFSTNVIEERNYLESITECIAQGSNCLAPLSFTWERPDAVDSTTEEVTECEPLPNNQEYCFTYDKTVTADYVPFATEVKLNQQSRGREFARMFDINADGYGDVIYEDSGWKVLYGPYFSGTPQNLSSIGSSDEHRQYALTIDYDGDGKQELLVANGASSNWHVLTYNPRTVRSERCYGGRVGECEEFSYHATFETVDLGRTAIGFAGAAQVMDVDGDGLQDIVFVSSGQIQMYHNEDSGGFSAAISLTSLGDDAPLFSYSHTRQSPKMKNSAAIDINGDGRSDLITKVTTTTGYCSTGTRVENRFDCRDQGGNWTETHTTNWKLFVSEGTIDEPRLTERDILGYQGDDLRATDLNGDGLTDVIYWVESNKTWYYALSNGIELGQPHKSVYVSEESDIGKMFFIDLNGDRRADILRPVINNWSILLSRPTDSADNIVWEFRGYVPRDKDDMVLFGDVNGDAKLDLLTTENNDGWYVKYAARRNIVDNVITEFNNGWDVKTTITYEDLLNASVNITDDEGNRIVGEQIADTLTPVTPMPVVKQVTSDVTDTHRESVSYRYGGLLLHRKGLGSLGFKLLQTTDNQTGVKTITSYSQQYPYINMPVRTTQVAADGTTVLSESSNQLAMIEATGFGGIYPYVDVATETAYQIGSDGTHYELATLVTDNRYDLWGNLTLSEVKVQDGDVLLHTTTTVNNFGVQDSYEQKFGRMLSTRVTKTPATGAPTLTRDSIYEYYDDNEVCNGVVQSKGMLKLTVVNDLSTTTCYDSFGHQTKEDKTGVLNGNDSGSTTIGTETVYTTDGRYIKRSSNKLGYSTSHKYNGVLAGDSVSDVVLTTTTTDANGVSVKQYFDNWGNKLAVKTAATATKTIKKAYCSSCVNGGKYYIEEVQPGEPTQRTTFDKFGREILTQVAHFNGGYSYVHKAYDNRGRLFREYLPRLTSAKATSATGYTQYNYDDYGREISRELPNYQDGEYQHPTITYAGLVTTITDARGNSTVETRNLLGELVRVEDADSGVLTYTYDAFGNVDVVTKIADGISIEQIDHDYFNYGQKASTADKDKGKWYYRYNAFGQMVWQKNAKQQETIIEYDSLGRVSRKYSTDFTHCWLYGTSGKEKGRLVETRSYNRTSANCNATDYRHARRSYYDNAGREYHISEEIKGVVTQLTGQYQTFNQYDVNGRLSKQHFAGVGLTIKHEYRNGYLYKLSNAATNRVYQHITEMNVYGQVKAVTYANGTNERIGYDEETGLATSHTLSKNGTLHDLAYGYDANGNLKWRSHSLSANSGNTDYHEEYTYDNLDRLTDREVILSGNGQYSMGGQYRYDGFGNFLRKSDTGYYQYNSNKQLQGVFANSQYSGAALYSFVYDNNGNITSDGKRSIRYSSFDKPIGMSQSGISTEFGYGIGHKRFYRHDFRLEGGTAVNSHTAYANGIEKNYRIKGSSENIEYKVFVGNVVLTERSNSTDNLSVENYLHKDHLGSPLTITNSQGKVVEQNVYDPWGKVHSLFLDNVAIGDRLKPTTKGYTGHEGVEGLNIIHMNGRIYDAQLGRFLQADPHIQSAKSLQGHNRFAYVMNNPLSSTDPSGYFLNKLFKKINKALGNFAPLFGIALMAIPGMQAWAAQSIWHAAAVGFVSGGVSTGSLKGALVGALAGAAFHEIGAHFGDKFGKFADATLSQQIQWAGAHGMAGGVVSSLSGGKFGHGFFSAGLTKFAMGNAGFNFNDQSPGAVTQRTIIAAAIGGTASVISGGKFANGARTAAMAHLFNAEAEYFMRGKLAHKLLQEYLKERDKGQWQDEIEVQSSVNKSGKGYLDLKHTATNGAFELKPNNYAGIGSGIAQLQDYVSANPGLIYGNNDLVFAGYNRITLYGTIGLVQYEFTYYDTDYFPGLITYDHSVHRNWALEAARVLAPMARMTRLFRVRTNPEPVLNPAY